MKSVTAELAFAEYVHPKLGRWLGPTKSLGAILAYGAISFWYFGRPLWGHFGSRYVGGGTDPTDIFMWALSWWPWAVSHFTNPFFTGYIWAPLGINLVWVGSIPLPSLFLWPVTNMAGPVVAYNILMLSAPVLAASAAYLLIRQLTGSIWIGFWGGYVYGFSSYFLGHMLGHSNLVLGFVPPLLAYLLLKGSENGKRKFSLKLALEVAALLAAQFLMSTEIFATMAVFGVLFLALAWLAAPVNRQRLVFVGKTLACGYFVALVVVSPFLYYLTQNGPYTGVPEPPSVYATDALNFVIPTPLSVFGPRFAHVSALFSGNYAEETAYLGVPLLVLLFIAVVHCWNNRWVRAASLTLVGIVIATMGPVLRVAGISFGPVFHIYHIPVGAMPWLIFTHLPLIRDALPGRFTMYVFLLAGCIGGWYLAQLNRIWSIPLAVLSILFLMPSISSGQIAPWTEIAAPPFITQRLYEQYIPHGANVLAFPSGQVGGEWSLYQAESGFWFRLAEAHIGTPGPPPPWANWQMAQQLFDGQIPSGPTAPRQFQAFLVAAKVREVISSAPAPAGLGELARATGLAFVGKSGGVIIWRVPSEIWSGT